MWNREVELYLLVIAVFMIAYGIGYWLGYVKGYKEGDADAEERVRKPSRW